VERRSFLKGLGAIGMCPRGTASSVANIAVPPMRSDDRDGFDRDGRSYGTDQAAGSNLVDCRRSAGRTANEHMKYQSRSYPPNEGDDNNVDTTPFQR